jgi:competence protein ComEA
VSEVGAGKWLAYAAAAILLVIAGARWLGSRDDARPAHVAIDAAPGASGGGSRHAGAELYVHVAGAVRRPGVYRLPAGSRVTAAVDRAGGPSRRGDVGAVNLAAPLEDGQQVVVPVRGRARPAAAGAAGSAPAGDAPAGPISLSSATPEELDTLDGIGPKLAARIVQYRDEHGGFRSLDQLREVEGIGEKRFAALREAIRP